MKLSSIKNLRTLNNEVLVKLPRGNDKVKVGGVEYSIDISYNAGKHVDVCGEVMAVPDKLFYGTTAGTELSDSMPWKTEMELQVGDTVYFDYFAAMMALGHLAEDIKEDKDEPDIKYFIVDNSVYISVKYESCYVAKRGDNVIVLNGYVLVEPVEKPTLFGFKRIGSDEDALSGFIRFIGNPNKEYLGSKYIDSLDVEIGDRIIFRRFNNQRLENEMHKTFDYPAPLFKMQRKAIVGKLIE